MGNEKRVKIDISATSVVKVVLTLCLIYLLFVVWDVLVLVFISLILVAALQPVVMNWSKVIGKGFSILAITLLVIGIIAGFVYLIVPPLIQETVSLIENIPSLVQKYNVVKDHLPSLESTLSSLASNFSNITSRFITITAGVFGGLIAFITILVLTIYMLIDEKFFAKAAASIIPAEKKDLVEGIISKISLKVGNWVRAQLLLGLIIGVLVFIGLTIMGVPYALTLAVLAGVLEIIPAIGPIVAGVVATLVALTVSPVIALIVAIFYILLQQIENHLIVPKIMQKAIGLPPAIIIIAVLIGGKLLGAIGFLLAVPVIAILYVILQEKDNIKKALKADEQNI